MVLRPSKRFEKALEGLTPRQGKRVKKALRLFQDNSRHRSLKFEKVEGTAYATIRINKGDRICLRSVGDETYDLVDLGSHDYIYRTYG